MANLLANCRVCESCKVQFLCNTHREHNGRRTTIYHYRCKACGSVFVANAFSIEDLDEAYSGLDMDSYYSAIQVENLKKMDTAVDYLLSVVPINAKILDIGTGNGLFMKCLRNAGFTDVWGHEFFSPISTEAADNMYHDYDYASVPSDHFDLVVLLDVAEHVINPSLLFNACARILKLGGLLYIHTPVVSRTDRIMHFVRRLPVLRRITQIYQRTRTSIFHLQNYTVSSMTDLLHSAGLDEICIRTKPEYSWPVSEYIRVYLVEQAGMGRKLIPYMTPVIAAFLSSSFFSSNKMIVTARFRRPGGGRL